MARESFIVYKSFYGLFELLPDDKRLAMYEAIFAYGFDGEIPTFSDKASNAIWQAIVPQLRANNARYENGCKGKEFGALGGAPMGNQNARKAEKKADEVRGAIEEKTTPNTSEDCEKKQPLKQPQRGRKVEEKTTPKTTPNENENENENNICLSQSAPAREIASLSTIFEVDIDVSDDDVAVLRKMLPFIERSAYLKQWRFVSKYLDYKDRILAGYYDRYTAEKRNPSNASKPSDATGFMTHSYTAEQLNAAFVNWDVVEDSDDD